MTSLFKPKIEKPAAPKPVRMPVETDPTILAASQRTRQAAMQRKGRQSTIMTDKELTGSTGQSLGA